MYVSPSCAYEVSCRVRAPPNGKTRQRATNPYRVKGGYCPSGPGPEFTPRKARGLTGDGFPAAVPAFLLIGAPGPEWTAFGAVGPEVQVRPRGTATSATIQTSATNCQPLRNRHNGCITTGKVARTDPFPQIAAGAGQPRAPAGRSTEIRRPFHPFGAAITRCSPPAPRQIGRWSFTGMEVSRSSMSVGHEPTLTGRSPCTGHAGHHPGARTGAAVAADRAVTFRGSGGPAAGVAVPLRCRSSSVPRRSVRRPGSGR